MRELPRGGATWSTDIRDFEAASDAEQQNKMGSSYLHISIILRDDRRHPRTSTGPEQNFDRYEIHNNSTQCLA